MSRDNDNQKDLIGNKKVFLF